MHGSRGNATPPELGKGLFTGTIVEETPTPPPKLGEGSTAVARNERKAGRGRGPADYPSEAIVGEIASPGFSASTPYHARHCSTISSDAGHCKQRV
jgi:hypothetical protein